MSDTVKLVIEIPRNEYEYTCERTLSDRTFWDDAIRNGILLDNVKAEIRELRDSWEKDCYHDEAEALNIALKIIDKHISAEKDNTWERTTETMKK